MWITELQFYINNIARCIGIVDIIFTSRKDHPWNTIIKCYTLLKSQLSKNNKKFQWELDLNYQSAIPSILFLIMSPSTNTQSISIETITHILMPPLIHLPALEKYWTCSNNLMNITEIDLTNFRNITETALTNFRKKCNRSVVKWTLSTLQHRA